MEILDDLVIRVDEAACHPVLMTLWNDYGISLLSSMFRVSGSEAEDIHERQSRRKQGFGAFLRQMKEERSVEDRLRSYHGTKGTFQSLLLSLTA